MPGMCPSGGSERADSRANDDWLFADVGGTNVRLCRWTPGAGAGAVVRSPADAFASLAEALRSFDDGQAFPANAALSIAVQVRGSRLEMSNRNWAFDAEALRAALGLTALRVVNDFVAAMAGVPALDAQSTQLVRAGATHSANLMLIGPGTGLGVAALLDAGGQRERIVASEGGHMGFGYPETGLAPLLAAVRAHWGRLSWERLLSGDGLARIHAWQAGLAAPLPPAEVSRRAAAGEPAARHAAQWFCRLLGACAGDLCLAFGADGGVWLTGGVLDGLGSSFDAAAFLQAFDDKGRYAGRVREVPVRRVAATDLAFRGLARIVGGASSAPGLLLSGAGLQAWD